MANPERGEVRLEVEGTVYTLKLSIGAAIALQKAKHKSIGAIFAAVAEIDIEAIVGLLWAALQTHHPRQFKTEEQVAALIQAAGGFDALSLVIEKLGELITLNKTPEKDGESAGPPSAQTGGMDESSTLQPVVLA